MVAAMKTSSTELQARRSRRPDHPIGIVIVDDHPAVRHGLAAMLEVEGDLDVLAAVPTARDGLAAIERLEPDVALLDFHLPDEDGLLLCLRTLSLPHPPRAIVFSAFADEALALQASVSGARGLVSKEHAPEKLREAVRAVAQGHQWLPPVGPRVVRDQAQKLAPADLPILAMLREEVPEAEIAETLGIEPDWLRARRCAIVGRLNSGARHDLGSGRAGRRPPRIPRPPLSPKAA
jgi:DNA-binding NarL/FixJ family response regulator